MILILLFEIFNRIYILNSCFLERVESFLGMPGKAKPCFPVGEGPEDSEPQPLRADSELMVSLAAPSRVPVTGNLLKEC